jgi:anti-sigma factor RsiW
MSRDDRLDELLGAYAVDALDDQERAEVEAYLAANPDARAEANRLGFAVEALAASESDPTVPPGAWSRIQAALTSREPGQLPPLELPREPAAPVVPIEHTGRRRRLAAVVLAAAAALVVGLAIGAIVANERSSSQASVESLADAAARNPSSRSATLTGTGAPVHVVVDPNGHGYLFAGDLAALPDGRTYQLWSLDGASPVSLGVLGADPGVVAFTAGGTTKLAITDEPAPGAVAPGQAPLVSGALT